MQKIYILNMVLFSTSKINLLLAMRNFPERSSNILTKKKFWSLLNFVNFCFKTEKMFMEMLSTQIDIMASDHREFMTARGYQSGGADSVYSTI